MHTEPYAVSRFEALLAAPTTVYRIFNADGDLIYVGITRNWDNRRSHHAANQPWWDEVDDIAFAYYPNRFEAAVAEREAIKAELPRYNRVHGVTGFRPPNYERPISLDPSDEQAAAIIAYIKALNVSRKEAKDIIYELFVELRLRDTQILIAPEEYEAAKAAQAKRL